MTTSMTHASISWNEAGEPMSEHFEDRYFSSDDGLLEARYVFLAHNNLAKRFSELAPYETITIGETGFGTGLNFLATWELFCKNAPATAHLHFLSAELYPLSHDDMRQALSRWPELTPQIEAFLSIYHGIHEGFQTLSLMEGRITLTLMIGDVKQVIPKIKGEVDAWFLDGFAPSKNPEMWSEELFTLLAQKSRIGATLATFTSAGFVRRGLIRAGFEMQKDQGFGIKREMLFGFYAPDEAYLNRRLTRKERTENAPWFRHSDSLIKTRSAIVIGGGVAGATSAYLLAQRGFKVTLLEKNDEIAREGSGNPQGILYLKLSAHRTDQTRFLIEGFGYTLRLLKTLTAEGKLVEGTDWAQSGVLQLSYSEKEVKRNHHLDETFNDALLYGVSSEKGSAIASVEVNHEGLFFPESGWVKPRRFCEALLDHPNITVITDCEVLSLSKTPSKEASKEASQNTSGAISKSSLHHWKVLTQNARGETSFEAETVILANATESTTLYQTAELPLKNIRGQVTYLPETPESQVLKSVICSDGYISPSADGMHCIGATFNFEQSDRALSNEEHAQNLTMLKTASEPLYHALNADHCPLETLQGRTAFRSTSPDYLPIVGPTPHFERFMIDYAVIEKDANNVPNTLCTFHKGLFINAGHGSRGLITAPLSAQLLLEHIEKNAFSVERDLVEACHPARFYIRMLRFPKRHETPAKNHQDKEM